MPGPYAHITLLHEVMQTGRLKSNLSSLSGFGRTILDYFPYCALGAVSPDYPNLGQRESRDSQWADTMHCTNACEMISSGIRLVKDSHGASRGKLLAWLLGYCAHLAADVTIHPVVQAKVGIYAENQRQHRVCEMNQDSYVYRRMNLGEIGESDSFALTVVQCGNPADKTRLDEDIITLWERMLKEVHPGLFGTNPPDCALWHRQFVAMVGGRQDHHRLFPLAGVISASTGLAYPSFAEVDAQYIKAQEVPTRNPFRLHYDEIFDLAARNVVEIWGQVELAVCSDGKAETPEFSNWNLDNGRDECGRLVFW